MGFPHSSVGKESAYNAGDPGSIPVSGRSTGEGTGYPLQYSWTSLVTQLVKNPPAMWETWVRSLGWKDPLKKERLPIPIFRLGEFHGLYSPWGRKVLDMTEQLSYFTKWNAVIIKNKINLNVQTWGGMRYSLKKHRIIFMTIYTQMHIFTYIYY